MISSRRAFTLIELLVVLAIVAVLLSLLLPAIGAVRASAKQLSCATRIRQIVVADILYAGDHSGQLSPSGVNWTCGSIPPAWGYSPSWGNVPYFNWPFLGPYLPGLDKLNGMSFATARGSILHCPADPRTTTVSYGMNLAISTEVVNVGPWPVTRVVSLSRPSEVVLFIDAAHWRWHPGYGSPVPCYGVDSAQVLDGSVFWTVGWGGANGPFCWTNWHRTRENMAFIDGHVRASRNPTAESLAGTAWFSKPP